MKHMLIPLIFLLCSNPYSTYANEALLNESSGVPRLIEGESKDIRMVSERVIIELGRTNYTVDASFEFMNDGDTITALVGFPDYGYGFIGKEARAYDSFETWVNGKPSAFTEKTGIMTISSNTNFVETVTNHDSLDEADSSLQSVRAIRDNGTRYIVKKVTFPRRTTTITRVRYTAVYSSRLGYIEYLYGTGRTWKGTIGRAVFVVRTSPDVWMSAVPRFSTFRRNFNNTRKFTKQRTGEFEHEFILTDIKPLGGEVFRVWGNWEGFDKQEQPWEFYSDFDFADKPVGDDFLDILSLAQLRLFHNAFYAYHGKKFNAPDLNAYFKDKNWYKPRDDYSDTDLTDIERENVRKIAAKEEWLNKLVESKQSSGSSK